MSFRISFAVLAPFVLAACSTSRCCREAGNPIPPAPRLVAVAPAAEPQVLLEGTLLRVPEATLARIGPKTRVLSASDGADYQARLLREPGVELLQLPAIVTGSGEDATLFVGEQYASEIDRWPSRGPDLWSGYRFHAAATTSADGRAVDLDYSYAARDEPSAGAPVDPTALAGSETRGAARESVGAGDVLVIPSEPKSPPARRFVLFVRAKAIPAFS